MSINNKIAVVDLGTNTFHTVIFHKTEIGVQEVFRKRHHVFLSEKGIKTIVESAIERAKSAILDFKINIDKHSPLDIHIIGTEGLRKASNGPELKSFIETTLESEVQVISGEREAELIGKGVLWQFNHEINDGLIMDIGGGSVEFIHLKNNEIVWVTSLPLGVGVLYNSFTHEEPISAADQNEIINFIKNIATPLVEYLKDQKVNTLIGASGSFELIPSIIEGIYPPSIETSSIALDDFEKIYKRILKADLNERLEIKGLPPVRAKLIVTAFILMNWMIELIDPKKLLISKYAVKEGLAAEKLGLLKF